MGMSNCRISDLVTSQDKLKEIDVGGDLFLSHRQSLDALYENLSVNEVKCAAINAYESATFDDDVDRLLASGW